MIAPPQPPLKGAALTRMVVHNSALFPLPRKPIGKGRAIEKSACFPANKWESGKEKKRLQVPKGSYRSFWGVLFFLSFFAEKHAFFPPPVPSNFVRGQASGFSIAPLPNRLSWERAGGHSLALKECPPALFILIYSPRPSPRGIRRRVRRECRDRPCRSGRNRRGGRGGVFRRGGG